MSSNSLQLSRRGRLGYETAVSELLNSEQEAHTQRDEQLEAFTQPRRSPGERLPKSHSWRKGPWKECREKTGKVVRLVAAASV